MVNLQVAERVIFVSGVIRATVWEILSVRPNFFIRLLLGWQTWQAVDVWVLQSRPLASIQGKFMLDLK